jgi:molybdate transport system substrate-binding protein
MKMRSFLAAAKFGVALLVMQGLAAEAAEVKVIAGTGMRPVLEELAPQFESATGHKLVIWYGIVSTIRQRIEAGEAFDLYVGGRVDEYTKQGKVAAGTRPEIARSRVAVGTRAGAPKPDISSVDAFKRAMLNARSVAYVPAGAVGIHVMKVFERLGISEHMNTKTKWLEFRQGGVVQAIANGEAELAFGFTNTFSGRGVELVGPFPPELQRYSVFTAGVGTAAEQPEAAKALIKFLTSPAAVAVIKAKGMESATH